MADKSIIRTIYLYLFALIGLVLIVVGSVNFINMGLKATIFKQAELQEALQMSEFPAMSFDVKRIEPLTSGEELTDEEKTALKDFLKTYREREQKYKNIDPITAKRQREASTNLSMLLVGIPLYMYHWRIIRKEHKKTAFAG